ncbi:hypothetical protein ABZ820_40930 [Streptomyces diacarni]|uniref:hypothetical protein n=1 Tax=Streptomyces diacarni TaxID=2800381 RepID=UPI0033CC691E
MAEGQVSAGVPPGVELIGGGEPVGGPVGGSDGHLHRGVASVTSAPRTARHWRTVHPVSRWLSHDADPLADDA